MLETYPNEVRLIIKHFPLTMHPFARKAAAAALAAHNQGKFWDYHHRLFEQGTTINDERLQAVARDLKLDMDAFNRDLSGPAVQAIISRDLEEGAAAGIPGTPTIMVNGRLLQDRGQGAFRELIESELQRTKGGATRK